MREDAKTRSGDRRVRLRDVAAAAEVDVSVVSRVLSGDTRLSIRDETRRRVLEAVERLDYRPNLAARSLRTARTMAVGMVVPDLANVVYTAIAEGAEDRVSTAGYVLLVVAGPSGQRVASLDGRIDGLLVAIATTGHLLDGLARTHMPRLLVNRHESAALPSIVVDDEMGAVLAVEHLLTLGHRTIAHAAGPQVADTARRRLAGYRVALERAGIEYNPSLVVEAGFDEEGGHRAAARILSLKPRPTAVFAANILAAIGVVAAARRIALRVPEDLSVVGFHDIRLAKYLDPPLTTVRMPLVELGRQAVDNLLAMIGGDSVENMMLTTPPELVVRQSSGPPT